MKALAVATLAWIGLASPASATNPTATVTCSEFTFSVDDAYADTVVSFEVDGKGYRFQTAAPDEAGDWPRKIATSIPFEGAPHDVTVTIILPKKQYPYDGPRVFTVKAPTDCAPAPSTTVPDPVTPTTVPDPVVSDPAPSTTVDQPKTSVVVVADDGPKTVTSTTVAGKRLLPETGNNSTAWLAVIALGFSVIGWSMHRLTRR
jgi:hypothetical protein